MSYNNSDRENPLNGDGSFVVGGVGGAIIMGPGGLQTQMALGMKTPGAIMGDTSGPNAVNPSGTQNGAAIRHAQQNNFRSYSTTYGRSKRRTR
jgi:hypothetical protein